VDGAADSKDLTAIEAKERVMPGSDISEDALQLPPQLTPNGTKIGGYPFAPPFFYFGPVL
jgi:hypothetical protein